MPRFVLALAAASLIAFPAAAQTVDPAPDAPEIVPDAPDAPVDRGGPEGSMTIERIGVLIQKLDADAEPARGGSAWQFTIEDTTLMLVSDPAANRMRLMAPIKPAGELSAEELLRLSQANFDTALDARYAVANGVLWSVFIHPLAALHDRQFVEAVGQTVNAAKSYGTTYSSGLLSYGNGDSRTIIQRELIEKLLRQSGEDI